MCLQISPLSITYLDNFGKSLSFSTFLLFSSSSDFSLYIISHNII